MANKAILEHAVTKEKKYVAPDDVWRHLGNGFVRIGTLLEGESVDDTPLEVAKMMAELAELQAKPPTLKRHHRLLDLEEALEEAGFSVDVPTVEMDEDEVNAARKAFDLAKKSEEGE